MSLDSCMVPCTILYNLGFATLLITAPNAETYYSEAPVEEHKVETQPWYEPGHPLLVSFGADL